VDVLLSGVMQDVQPHRAALEFSHSSIPSPAREPRLK
jgi:hypothetical protein